MKNVKLRKSKIFHNTIVDLVSQKSLCCQGLQNVELWYVYNMSNHDANQSQYMWHVSYFIHTP